MFEEKVSMQLGQMRMQADRLREASLARLEEKIHAIEAAQAKANRGLAELSGRFRGVSDEVQAQIRHINVVEERLTESRRQIEEGFRKSLADVEQDVKKASKDISECHSSQEDQGHKLMQRCHKLQDELAAQERSLGARVEDLDARLEDLAQAKLDELEAATSALAVQAEPPRQWASPQSSATDVASAAHLSILERRVGDLARKVEETSQDSGDVYSQLAAQEQQLRTLAMKADSRDEMWRELKDRVDRSDWEGKMEQLRRSLSEGARQASDSAEQLSRLSRKLEMVEQTQEEAEQRLALAGRRPEDQEPSAEVADCLLQVQAVRESVDALGMKAEIAERAQEEFGPRMSSLVEQLTELVPKIVRQERRLGEIEPRLLECDAALRELREHGDGEDNGSGGGAVASRLDAVAESARKAEDGAHASTARLEQLEPQVQQLRAALDELRERQSAGSEVAARVELVAEEAHRAGDAAQQLQERLRAEVEPRLEKCDAAVQELRGRGDRSADAADAISRIEAVAEEAKKAQESVAQLSEATRLAQDTEKLAGQVRERLAEAMQPGISGLVRDVTGLKDDVSSLTKAVQEEIAGSSAALAERTSLEEGRIGELSEQLSRLLASTSEQERRLGAAAEAAARAEALADDARSAQERLSAAEPKISHCEAELEALKAQVLKSADRSETVSRLESLVEERLSAAEPKISHCETELQALKAQVVKSSDKSETVSRLEALVEERLSAAEPKISHCETELQALKAQIVKSAESNETISKLETLVEDARQAKAATDSLRERLSEVEPRILECHSTLQERSGETAAKGAGSAPVDLHQLTSLLEKAREDQEAESQAHSRLLQTVDQLCGRLAAVEKAL